MSEPMTKDKLRQIAEWIEIIAYNEMSDPSSKFLVEAFKEIVRLRERESDLECMLEKECHEHDEARGYRQHAENLLQEVRLADKLKEIEGNNTNG